MSWRDDLRQPSFRGAIFQWQDESLGPGGRRGPDHEYPLRDTPFGEDLGRNKKTFQLSGFVTGPDYAAQRNALIAACDKAGPGLLVHPLWGEGMVLCRGCVPRETTRRLGRCDFTLTFVEAGEQKSNAVLSGNTGGRVSDTALACHAANASSFAADFVGEPATGVVAQGSIADSGSLLGTIKGVMQTVRTDANAAFNFISTVTNAAGELRSQIAAPLGLAQLFIGIIRTIALIGAPAPGATRTAMIGTLPASDPLAAIPLAFIATLDRANSGVAATPPTDSDLAAIGAAFATLSTVDPSFVLTRNAPPPVAVYQAPDLPTAALQARADNLSALLTLVRVTALVCACQASSAQNFIDYEDAVAWRDDLSARLDLEILAATDEGLYRALRDMRVAMVRDITTRAAALPHLLTYVPVATMPALLLAYKLYDDPSREAEIVARNDIAAPAFVMGAQPVLVLSDV